MQFDSKTKGLIDLTMKNIFHTYNMSKNNIVRCIKLLLATKAGFQHSRYVKLWIDTKAKSFILNHHIRKEHNIS